MGEVKILRWKELFAKVRKSRPQIWRDERAGKFPSRVKLGANSVGWRSDEIDAWLENLPRVGGERVIIK